MERYPWYFKLTKTLDVYFRFVKKISTIIHCKSTSDKTKMAALRMLLITSEEELIQVERDILTEQLCLLEEEVLECQMKVQAGPIKCVLFLN